MDHFFYLMGWVGFVSVMYLIVGYFITEMIIRHFEIEVEDHPSIYRAVFVILWPLMLIIAVVMVVYLFIFKISIKVLDIFYNKLR